MASSEPSATISPNIVTVVTIEWTTDAPMIGYVEYGLDTSYGLSTPTDDVEATEHSALLLGLTADTTYHYRTVMVSGDEHIVSDDYTFTTGTLPNTLPQFTLSVNEETSWSGFLLIPFLGSIRAAVILDDNGQYVWYHVIEDDVALGHMMLSMDKKSILYNTYRLGSDTMHDGTIVRVALDGSSTETFTYTGMHHDFVELLDGGYAFLVYDTREYNGQEFTGDKLLEVDADGNVLEVWNAWDSLEPPDEHLMWSHANALDYDNSSETYHISLKNLNLIAEINRTTHSLSSTIGGSASSYVLEEGLPTSNQHQFEKVSGGIVIFDNGDNRGFSRAVEYELDEEDSTMREVWSYSPNTSFYTYALGDVDRLENGNTLIAWGAAGQIQEVTTEGETVWQLNTAIGLGVGFFHHVETLY